MNYSVCLGDRKIGTCELGTCDPSMGVANALVSPCLEPDTWVEFLKSIGAVHSDGIYELRDIPELHVKDSKGCKVGAQFCFLQHVPELDETWIDACGIPWQEYELRFEKKPPNKAFEEGGST